MAHSLIATLIDDIDQSAASETVSFSVDGTAYEIDLSAKHASELRSIVSRYISVARTAAVAAEARADDLVLTDGEKQELRNIADAGEPRRNVIADRLRTKGLVDRDTAGNWWLTNAGRRELTSALSRSASL